MTERDLVEGLIRHEVAKEPRIRIVLFDGRILVKKGEEYHLRICFPMANKEAFGVAVLSAAKSVGDFMSEVRNMIEHATDLMNTGLSWTEYMATTFELK